MTTSLIFREHTPSDVEHFYQERFADASAATLFGEPSGRRGAS